MANAMDAAIQNSSQALDTSGIGKGTVEGLQAGMGLAQRQQEIQQQRQTMQFQQDQHEIQKMDWFHGQLKDVATETDPSLRKIKVEALDESYTNIFKQRMTPAVGEWAKRVSSAPDAMLAMGSVWDAMNDPNLNVPSNQKLAYAKEVLNHWSGDPSEFFKQAAQMKGYASSMQKALISARVATPQAAAAAGMPEADLQNKLTENNPITKRVTSQQEMAAQTQVNKDPLLNAYKQRLDGAGRVYDLINDAEAGKVKTNKAFLGQLNAEVGRLETGSQSPGLGASEKTELLSAAAQFEGLKERFTGKPDDAVPPEIIAQVKGTMNSMTDSYMKSIDDRYSTLQSGLTEVQKPIVAQKKQSDISSYTKKFGRWTGSTQPAEAQSEPQARLTTDDMDKISKIADERVRQARAASQSGVPLPYTEGDVKDWYKSKTGKEYTK